MKEIKLFINIILFLNILTYSLEIVPIWNIATAAVKLDITFNDDNKYKYKAKNMRKNIFEVSKENNENCFNNNKYFSNAIFNNYIKDSFKRKNDNLITHYTRKRNVKSFNRLFNEVHEENPKYNLMKYYGKNYSRKNYSQFELH